MRAGGCLAESKASTIDSVMRMPPSSELEKAGCIRGIFGKGSEIIDNTARHPGTFQRLRKGAADFSGLSVEEKKEAHPLLLLINSLPFRVTTRTHRMKGGRAVDVHPSGFLDRLRIEDGLNITL